MIAYEIRNTHVARPLSRHWAGRVMSARWMTMQDLPGIPNSHRHVMIRHMGNDNDGVLVRGLRKSYQGHQAVLGLDPTAERGRGHDPAHHALPGGSRGARQPDRRHQSGPRRRTTMRAPRVVVPTTYDTAADILRAVEAGAAVPASFPHFRTICADRRYHRLRGVLRAQAPRAGCVRSEGGSHQAQRRPRPWRKIVTVSRGIPSDQVTQDRSGPPTGPCSPLLSAQER